MQYLAIMVALLVGFRERLDRQNRHGLCAFPQAPACCCKRSRNLLQPCCSVKTIAISQVCSVEKILKAQAP